MSDAAHEGEAACEVVTTTAGFRAMRDRATGELMHPGVGPREEAARLYVAPSCLEARLAEAGDEPLVLLDVGLGAGSNAIAAWHVSERAPRCARRLAIVSFDRTLAPLALALAPLHAAAFGFDAPARIAGEALHRFGVHETARTEWRLVAGDLLAGFAAQPAACADIVFWDPFSPRQNPALWTVAAFRAVRRLCRPGATLHTYSGATAVRSALLLAGFAVGFGVAVGARQTSTTVAALSAEELLAPLDARWLARLQRSSAALPSDAPPNALACIAALPQFRR